MEPNTQGGDYSPELPQITVGIGKFMNDQVTASKQKPYFILAAIVVAWWLFFKK